ncbi:hypothetical protein GCM10019059_34650 [Camelimonas fluminis]|uniref:Uncharacterized protein n=2 Tax=Camelimonas fluminis TaxID=1576911 RepID=A0ABV7UGB5_9HYPH|nr:hypothetical protein GCM10019059_34650 [Camelimonas fluminis]
MTDISELISAGLDTVEAVAKAEDRSLDWVAGFRAGLVGLRMSLDGLASQGSVAQLVASHGAQHVIDKFRFASAWAKLAMNNLRAHEEQNGWRVPDDEVCGYVSAGGFEGSLQIRIGDVRSLADAFQASKPAADTFIGTVDTDSELQAAAREAGWALEQLINETDFRKRPQVEGIITRLGLALEATSLPPAPAAPDEPVACADCGQTAMYLDDLVVGRFDFAAKAKLERKHAEGRKGWNDKDVAANALAINAELLDQARLFQKTIEYYIRRNESDGDHEGARMKLLTLYFLQKVIARAEQAMGGAEGTP